MFRNFNKRKSVGVLAVLAALVVGVSAYAFTASNTGNPQVAGAGAFAVSGFTVSDPANYTFSADGTKMVDVTFSLNKDASDAAVALTDGVVAPVNADWAHCDASNKTGSVWTTGTPIKCVFPTPVANASGLKLSVAAVGTGTVTIAP